MACRDYYQVVSDNARIRRGDKQFMGTSCWQTQGWGNVGGISGLGWQTGGTIGGKIMYSDSFIFSPDNLGMDVTDNKLINIKMKTVRQVRRSNLFYNKY
jgi:hypothetical protein